jgi:thiol-disulfide isomerase/thioredoxin
VKGVKVLAGALFFVLFTIGARAEEGLDALFEASMIDIHGKPMTLSHFRGKPLIVSFWERVCPICRDGFPELAALQTKYEKRGLIVLGIALEKEPDKVREFLAVYKANYPVVLAGKQRCDLMQGFGNDGCFLPYTLLVNRKGEVIFRKHGPFKESDFQAVAGEFLR